MIGGGTLDVRGSPLRQTPLEKNEDEKWEQKTKKSRKQSVPDRDEALRTLCFLSLFSPSTFEKLSSRVESYIIRFISVVPAS